MAPGHEVVYGEIKMKRRLYNGELRGLSTFRMCNLNIPREKPLFLSRHKVLVKIHCGRKVNDTYYIQAPNAYASGMCYFDIYLHILKPHRENLSPLKSPQIQKYLRHYNYTHNLILIVYVYVD